MKKIYSYLAAAVAALALNACSEDSFTQDDLVKAAEEQAGDVVSFDVYTGNQTSTRADEGGIPGVITTASLKTGSHATTGFGVFAYLTADDYSGNIVPNFMYNEEVKWSSSTWTYSPVKYWPNGNDAANTSGDPSNSATSTNTQRLSFFAYAPRVVATASTGVVTSATVGITNLPENDVNGRPILTYKLFDTTPTSTPGSIVDLLWGLRGQASYVETDGSASEGTVGSSYNVNLYKQTVDERVKFLFKHALAKIGGNSGLKVVYDIDGNSTVPESGFGATDYQTLVTIKSITIKDVLEGTGDDTKSTIIQSGKFDISQGVWSEWGYKTGSSSATQTTLAKLSCETGNALNTAIAEPYNTSTSTYIVPTYNTTTQKWTNPDAGVTTTAQNVCGSVESNPILLIPGKEGQKLEIEIEYIVRTYDEDLDASASGETGGTWTKVTQKVTNIVTLPALDVNKYYTLVIHLGLTSVKFSAEVADWDEAVSTDSKVVWLPSNVVKTSTEVAVDAGTDDIVYTAANTTSYTITLNNLVAENKVKIDVSGSGASLSKVYQHNGTTEIDADGDSKYTVAAGETDIKVNLTLTENTNTTSNNEVVVTLTEEGSKSSTTVVKIVQYRKDS